jgi:hypothetical protein
VVENIGGKQGSTSETSLQVSKDATTILLSPALGDDVAAAYGALPSFRFSHPRGCDGIVAADEKVFSAEEIAEKTAGPLRVSGDVPPDGHSEQAGEGKMAWSKVYAGTDSPAGCGSNSKYRVLWKIVKVP